MAEGTPPDWRDTCEHCGGGFGAGEPRWLEQRRYFVHTRCAHWELWEDPPYVWKLKQLRRRYRGADGDERKRLARARQSIQEMQAVWPDDAAEHVGRALAAVLELE